MYSDKEIDDIMQDVHNFIIDKHFEIVDASILSEYYVKLCNDEIINMKTLEDDCYKEVKQLKRFMPRLKDDVHLFEVMTQICDEHFDKLYKNFNSVDKLYVALLKLCYEKDKTLRESIEKN